MRGITRAATVFAVLPWLVLGTPSKHATFNGTRSIEWNPCKIAGSLPGECGHLKVPLDYTNPNSSAKLDLSIIKVPAPGKKQGSLFVNFGGPGASGIDDLADTAERIQAYVNNSSSHPQNSD